MKIQSKYLSLLPPPPDYTIGWPWTEETATSLYDKSIAYPKISVVTISYNQGQYIEETIRSVLLQNYPNIEYIIIDGGSTDKSADIIKKYEQFLTYWVSEKDKGPANALNKGFSKASGEIYYYINSDDLLLPNAFIQAINFINKNPCYDVYYGHGYTNKEGIKKLMPTFSMTWNLNFYRLRTISIFQPATFIRSEIFKKIGGFNEKNSTQWDGELLVDLEFNHAKFVRFNVFVAIFRLYSESISGGDRLKKQYFSERSLIEKRIMQNKKMVNYPFILVKILQLITDTVVTIKQLYYKVMNLR